jgi:hypothetical protein
MPGIDVSNGRASCRGCGKKIKKGEKRFHFIGDEYSGHLVTHYWHPSCYFNFNPKTVESMIEVFLPLVIGEEASAPIILALRMGKAPSVWRICLRYERSMISSRLP